MDFKGVRWDRVRLALEILLGLLAWYLLWLSYPLQNVFPIYGKY
jgi:hypothetical protein